MIANASSPVAPATRSWWNAVVIGAGPAGALTALGLARAGLQVLLVEAKPFPRDKVCGGCLNQCALDVIAGFDLAGIIQDCDPVPLHTLRLTCRRRDVSWPLSNMVAVRRSIFDALLVQAAVDCGAVFSSNTTASVPVESADAERVVALRSSDGITRRVAAEVVICADGLSHPSLAHHAEFASRVRPASRVGLQTIIPGDVCLFPRGQLSMSIGREGYVGATFVGKDRLNIAAAVNPKYLTGGRRPWEAVGEILHQCRLPVPDALATAAWSGTPPLTRVSPTLSARRLFLIGDAAGYVEPFTGEGIAWALTSAESVVPIVVAACTHWSDSLSLQWRQVLKNKVTKNQWMCRILSRLLRRPQIAGLAVDLCRLLPPLRKMAISRVSGARRIKNPAGCIR